MPSYNNFAEVFFTVQALRMYQNMYDTEILIVDNYGKDPMLENFVKGQGAGQVRYEKYTECTGPANAKNAVFDLAKGEMVMCMDSHVMLMPGALDEIKPTDDLVQGPLMYNDLKNFCLEWKPEWRGHMWGIWGDTVQTLPNEPKDIWGMGMGLFMTSKSGWLRFNAKCRGFGGAEEGIIHEKYRQHGRRVICDPRLAWIHHFDRPIPYPLNLIDRVINYIISFEEIGLSTTPIMEHFGAQMFNSAMLEARKR